MPLRVLAHAAFWLTATGFILSLPATPYNGDFILKAAPIACLVILVLAATGDYRRWMVVAALVFSGAGDISLELGQFTLGLAAFLVGHLFYLLVFCRGLVISRRHSLPLAGLLLYLLVIIPWLQPHLGDMQAAVYLYMAVITSMAVAALLGRYNHGLVALGAVLFVLSDSLIAINRFIEPVPGARYWIMVTYYLAQYLLTRDARCGNYRH